MWSILCREFQGIPFSELFLLRQKSGSEEKDAEDVDRAARPPSWLWPCVWLLRARPVLAANRKGGGLYGNLPPMSNLQDEHGEAGNT